jgi:hypothetical protein
MGGIFGKGTSARQSTAAGSLQVQGAARGGVIPLVYGTTRVAVNVVDYDDFHSTMVDATQAGKGKGGGGGGGGGKSGKGSTPQVTEYIASFILAVCTGPIVQFGQIWYDRFVTTFGAGTLVPDSVNLGLDGQATDPYWAANHVTKAINYSGTANAVFAQYNLGVTATLPNFSCEVYSILSGSGINGLDSDPSQMIADFLTNSRYGAGFPLSHLDPVMTDQSNPVSYASYVRALGLWMSISMETQQDAQQSLDTLTKLTNSEVVWSGGLLKVIPRGDQSIIGSVTRGSAWSIILAGGDASGSRTVTVTISDPVLGTFSAGVSTISGEHLQDIANNLLVSLAGIVGTFNIIVTNVTSAMTPPAGPPPLSQNNTAIVTISLIQDPPTGTTTVSTTSPAVDFTATVNATTVGGIGIFTPNSVPIYSLTDDDFIPPGSASSVGSFLGPNPGGSALRTGATPVTGSFSDDPVHIVRSSPADADNLIRLECLDRGASYNSTVIEVSDQGAIDAYGQRAQGSINARSIVDPGYVGYTVAQLLLQRSLMYRNTYTFQLGWKYILLEPMDLIRITDARLGASGLTVRITAVEEDTEGTLTITAEDYFGNYSPTVQYPSPRSVAIAPSLGGGSGSSVPSPTVLGIGGGSVTFKPPQLNSGSATNFAVTPGSVNPPAFIEPPSSFVTSPQGYELWIALSSKSLDWGGAQVLVSTDGASYAAIGEIRGASAMGALILPLAAYSGAEPDTLNTLSVDLSESNGMLTSVSEMNGQLGVSLCWVSGEMLSYVTAQLIGGSQYRLTRLYRGQGGSSILAHNLGDQFVAIGRSIGRFGYPQSAIGTTLYFKFPSVNMTGNGVQDPTNLTVYTYTLQGNAQVTVGSSPNFLTQVITTNTNLSL